MMYIHETKSSLSALRLSCRRTFFKCEDGSATIESIIWFPIFAVLLSLMMNISMVFFNESQILRIVQDGNRAFSLGRFDDTKAVEDYIADRLAYLDANLTIQSIAANGFITTTLSTPATDLMPFNFLSSAFSSIDVGVNAQHIIEF